MSKKVLKSLNYHRKNHRLEWEEADDIRKSILKLTAELKLDWLETSRIFCYRSRGAQTSARARIWGLPKIWQKALQSSPAYVVEVISEKFDNLSAAEKREVLLHEIAHIPKNFSGALVPHYRRGKRKFQDKVRLLLNRYNTRQKS